MSGSELYRGLLEELESVSDPAYREFHKKLLKNENINVLGVKIPVLRKIARKYSDKTDVILTFPDEFYEVTFIKLAAVSLLDYGAMMEKLDRCVHLIDNWATCDTFAPRCIKSHREEFLPVIRAYAQSDGEFVQRFAFTTLLNFYVEEKYLETIFSLCERADTSMYYVHMAVAWLIAETLAKYFERARGFLLDNSLDRKTHNKAISKALESYRLTNDQKNYLKGIKR